MIFGAAVWLDGQPSNAMRRRVEGALTTATGQPNALFLATGGVGKHPPSEARIMRNMLLEKGIAEPDILLDEASTDTLSSVRNCTRILHALPELGDVVICSDVYHIPRCRWLFHLYGIPSRAGQVESGRRANTALRWMYYYTREALAIPWDTALVLLSQLLSRKVSYN